MQPNPLLFLHRADSSLLLTHTVAGETQWGPQPLCTRGDQGGTSWLLVSLFSPSPLLSSRGQGGLGLKCASCGSSMNNYIQMG